MTRTYAAIQLLRLEPICLSEFVEVTGWKYRACQHILYQLQTRGKAKQIKRRLWTAV